MKIKISRHLVIGTLLLATIIGCGGSGVPASSAPFAKGMYVATGSSIQSYDSIVGANPHKFPIDQPSGGVAFDKQNRMYYGTEYGQLVMMNGPGDKNPVVFGTKGTGPNQFYNLNEIRFDSLGRIYVSDFGNGRIARLDDMTGKNWTTLDLNQFGGPNGGSGASVALDSQDRIYAVYRSLGLIRRFNSMTDSSPLTFGSHGNGVNQFDNPIGIHIGAGDLIYVADCYNNRIVRISSITGAGWTTLGSKGPGALQFDHPVKVTTNDQNQIYVADFSNYRIAFFDSMTGTSWHTFGNSTIFPGVQNILVH